MEKMSKCCSLSKWDK